MATTAAHQVKKVTQGRHDSSFSREILRH